MDKINLCIDIGNTSTKAALFSENKEVDFIKPFSANHLVELRKQYELNILVSKTGANSELESMLEESHFLTHHTPIPIQLDYATPHTLGRDRIATAVGAYYMNREAAWLIIDLGTCLTIDILADGVFRGGLISPGVQMRFQAMHEFTAGLPLVKGDYTTSFPGKTTEESMQVGVSTSIGYEIDGYIREVNKQFDRVNIVDCSSRNIDFAFEVKNEIFARPKLVLEGLNQIIEYNAKK